MPVFAIAARLRVLTRVRSPFCLSQLQERGLDALKAATKNYTMIPPPKADDALQQGGLMVVNGKDVLYAWRDEGTADHAPVAQILAACAAA